MKNFKLLLCLGLGLILSACGGGGSSSGGGDNAFAGTYEAAVTVTFRFSGGINSTSSTTTLVTLTVNKDGSYSIVDGGGGPDSIRANGTLDGNKFRASGSGAGTEQGVTCNLTLTYAGSIVNNTATGRVSGNGNCTGNGTSANVNLEGDLSLPKTANAKSFNGPSIMSDILTNM